MGDRWLTDLADVLRAAGLDVTEDAGWQTRGRSSGGYSAGLPDHVMVHHTASSAGADPASDVAYICRTADAAPLANLYLSRSGAWTVCAAGASNTNGSGSAWWPGGPADDSMNSAAIGIEAGNDGVGEPWPIVQQDSYLAGVAALCAAYGIPVDHVRAHFEWTDRKVDAAGPSMYAAGATSWNMDLFRTDVAAWTTDPPPDPVPPDPPIGDLTMTTVLILEDAREPFPRYRCGASSKTWIRDGDALAQCELRLGESAGGTRPAIDGFVYTYLRHGGDDVIASYGPLVGPVPPQRDTFGRLAPGAP